MATRSREDQAIYFQRWYVKNKARCIAAARKRQLEIQAWMRNYKKSIKCSRCDESNPVCLDFHHRDPSQKTKALGLAANSGWSVGRIKDEIDKCDILCANCHRKEHARILANECNGSTDAFEASGFGSIPN